jgi:GTP cyclohydrolase I
MDLQLQEELTTPIIEALDHVSKTHAVMEGTADEDMR